jgi:hypothetical protein
MAPDPIPLRADHNAIQARAMDTLVRSCIATAYSKLNPGSRNVRSFTTARWGDAEARSIDAVLTRAASTPATTTTASWAGVFSPIVTAFLANLVPYSAAADLLNRGLKLGFDSAGQVNIPNLALPLADFVAQGGAIPIIQGTTSLQGSLAASKFASIVVLSNELIASSNAEALTRDALLQSTGPSLDRRLFDSNAVVPGLRPAGLLRNITPIAATSGSGQPGADYAAMAVDLKNITVAVADKAGNGGGISIIAAPEQALNIVIGLVQGTPWPLLMSSALAPGIVIAVANSAVVSAFGEPEIDTTRVASVVMDDAAGAIGAGGTVKAAFQTDMTGVRLRWPITWCLRDPAAIAYVQSTAW